MNLSEKLLVNDDLEQGTFQPITSKHSVSELQNVEHAELKRGPEE